MENQTAIILMGHGSRVPGAGEGMEKVAGILKGKKEGSIVEVCYMERQGPRFGEALKKCTEQGAKRVILIPYFLHMGLHIKVDIPSMMQKEASRYPGVSVIFGHNLGFDELLVDLVEKRVRESQTLPDVRDLNLEKREAYPLPPGESVFVPMPQDEAEHFKHYKHEH